MGDQCSRWRPVPRWGPKGPPANQTPMPAFKSAPAGLRQQLWLPKRWTGQPRAGVPLAMAKRAGVPPPEPRMARMAKMAGVPPPVPKMATVRGPLPPAVAAAASGPAAGGAYPANPPKKASAPARPPPDPKTTAPPRDPLDPATTASAPPPPKSAAQAQPQPQPQPQPQAQPQSSGGESSVTYDPEGDLSEYSEC